MGKGAIDTVTVEYKLELGQLRADMDSLKSKFKESEKSAKKAAKETGEAYNKNARSISELTSNMRFLEKARDKAFNPAAAGKLNDRIKEIKANIDKLSNATANVPKPLSLAEKATGVLNSSMGKLAAAAAGAFAVDRILSFAGEAVELALKVEGIEKAYNKLNRPDLLDKLRVATKGTVDDMTLMQNAVKANNFKIPLDALAGMFAFAEQRARDTGESVDFLVESAVLGISRQSVMIIDNLGISAKAVQAEMEKTGDFATAVSNIMAQEVAKQGDIIEGAGVKVDRYAAQWQNFKIGFGKMLVDMGVGLASGLEKFDSGLKTFFNTLTGGDGYRNGGLLFSNDAKKDIGWVKTAYKEVLAAASKGNKFAIAELERRAALEKAATENKKKNSEVTIEKLKQELEYHQQLLDKQDIGSVKFKNTLKEIQRIQKQIDTATGKNTAKTDEQQKQAAWERDRLKRKDVVKQGVELTLVDNGQNRLDLQQTLADKLIKQSETLEQSLTEINAENEEKRTKKAEEQEALRQQMRERAVDAAMQLTDALFEFNRARNENEMADINSSKEFELAQLEDKKTRKLITEEQYTLQKEQIEKDSARRLAEVERKQAIADRNQNVFAAFVNTAQSIVKTGAELGYPAAIPFQVMAGIIGATQIAAILSRPLPEVPAFEQGGLIKGNEKLIRVNEKGEEFIANAKATRENMDDLQAMNKSSLAWKQHIKQKYVMPALRAAEREVRAGKSEPFVVSDNSDIIGAMKRGIRLDRRTIQEIGEVMPKFKQRTGFPNG